MQFSLIGTGNMAWFLANKLTKAGHQCSCVYGRNPEAAKLLADAINSRPAGTLQDINGHDDATILAISDGALPQIASQLVAGNTVLIHTSGAATAAILDNAKHFAVMWPIYSINKNNLPVHRDIPCAIDANDVQARLVAKNLAHAFTDIIFDATLRQRQWLHLAAVVSNNFINHLMAIGEAICREQQLDTGLLFPILQQTFDRASYSLPSEMQTGPASRNDQDTINAQLELLKDHPEWHDIYRAITISIQHSSAQAAEKATNS